jgi:pyruvate, water dikinase
MLVEKDLLEKIKFCFASLFTDRAISYREDKGFDHFKVKLSVAVQKNGKKRCWKFWSNVHN